MLYLQGHQVHCFQAADIDRRHRLARRIFCLGEGMNAAARAESMLDGVLVEGIGAHLLFGSEQAQPVARHEPEKRALARADGTVASHDLLELALDLEGDSPA